MEGPPAAVERFTRVMGCQLKAAIAADHPHLVPLVGDDLALWTWLVVNLPDPYAGGEYLFQLRAPPTFPRSPPEFVALTPNGVFEPGGKICISIGEFHADARAGAQGSYGWRPVLGMAGFAREVVNGLIDPEGLGGGIRVIRDPPATRRRLAQASREFNALHHPELMARFAQQLDPAAPPSAAISEWRRLGAVDAACAAARAGDRPAFARLLATFGCWAPLAGAVEAARPETLALGTEHFVSALRCRDPVVQAVLIAALAARLEAAGGAPAAGPAYQDFLAKVPGVCASPWLAPVAEALARLGGGYAAFEPLHREFAEVLACPDLDEKAARARALHGALLAARCRD
jgi:ubiquitin-conjugating enzyme E2 J2